MTIAEIIASILVIIATVMAVSTTILQFRAPDALTRVNLLGPLTSVGVPLLIVAKLIIDWSTTGFEWHLFIRAVIAIAAMWVIAAVGSFIMGRSMYGVTIVDKKHGIEE
ncbi:Na+/H+ antiporter subunit G [Corynebacterium sp.]|uniref:Na+/H+ antiporter subunit G n=1 Tax=Corynebacterium sp. TaxID=1720 RepID=UPI00373613A5